LVVRQPGSQMMRSRRSLVRARAQGQSHRFLLCDLCGPPWPLCACFLPSPALAAVPASSSLPFLRALRGLRVEVLLLSAVRHGADSHRV